MLSSTPFARRLILLCLGGLLSACGGGGGGSDDDIPAGGGSVTLDNRISAARSTAANHSACASIEPFYWEIGDRNAMVTGNSEGDGTVQNIDVLRIASASKWVFAAYVLEKRNNVLSEDDIKALTMRSGYSQQRYRLCIKGTQVEQDTLTVEECFEESAGGMANSDYEEDHDGKFYYNGGHFQHWAVENGLADEVNSGLRIELGNEFGNAFVLDFDSPQPAGGMAMSSLSYAFFLRSILNGDLRMSTQLGTNAVCADPVACPDDAVSTPIPADETWHYSLGHWIEDDPEEGDGTFSSPGYFGFYPWIDSGRKWYGVVAREVVPNTLPDLLSGATAQASVECGRVIRKAWLSGLRQS